MKAMFFCLAATLAAVATPGSARAELTARDMGVVAVDLDGDKRADLAIKFQGGTWRIDYGYDGLGVWNTHVSGYGGVDAVPVPADYDGDHRADLSVKTHGGHWLIDHAQDGFGGWGAGYPGYGGRDAHPVPADYDGDGKADLSVKSDAGQWFIDYAKDGFGSWNAIYDAYGGPDAHPVPADYDGDGKADLSVKSDAGQWFIDDAKDGFGSWNAIYDAYGGENAHPVPADYDGDGKSDLSIKSDAGEWFIDFASDGFHGWNAIYAGYGPASSRPLPADYDGDDKADLAVKEDCGRLYIDYAANGFGRWDVSVGTASVHDNQITVSTREQLFAVLNVVDYVGTVWVASREAIELTGLQELPLNSCIWLRGRRQDDGSRPQLFTDDKANSYALFRVLGNGVRVEGLWLRGPQKGDLSEDQPNVSAVSVVVNAEDHLGFDLVVDNNEMNDWTNAAVDIHGTILEEDPADVPPGTPRLDKDTPGIPVVRANYLHNNAVDSKGYGVVVSHGGYALIEGNVFDYNRHAVASGGQAHTGYLAFHNLVLGGGYAYDAWGPFSEYGQHFDVHGVGEDGYGGAAGEYYEIAFNTIYGEQEYYLGIRDRPAFMLRGRTAIVSNFHHNVVVHDDLDEAVALKMNWYATGIGEDHDAFNFRASDNEFDANNRWREMGVGDFDGDGRDDVLLTTGRQWFYSSAGKAEWRFLAGHSERIGELRFGQFDALPGTDVFVKDGNRWFFSSGGSAWWQPLRPDNTSMADLLFGDFDGDGQTDVLKTDGTNWYISRRARGAWQWINTSKYRAADLRVGDFDGDGRDDVFSLANGDWSYSSGASTTWIALNQQPTSSLAGLVFQDFDQDGRTDVARSSGGSWQFRSGGKGWWVPFHTPPAVYGSFAGTLFGDFSGDGQTDALRYSAYTLPGGVVDGTRFVAWLGMGSSFQIHSRNDMR